MKHIFACLILSCALILASACSLAAQYNYQPMDADRIVYSLPEGLSARVTKADGQINVLVDSEKTDWDQLVTHVNSSSTIRMDLSSKAPSEDVTQYHQVNLRNGFTPNEGTMLEQAFTEFDIVVNSEFSNKKPTDLSAYTYHYNSWELAGFDAESNAILPYPAESNTYVAYLIVWYAENSSPIYEYYFINISFTDDSARKVTMSNVPQSRLFPHLDSNMNTVCEAGSLRYEIPLGHALCDQEIYTYIQAPAGAKSWKINSFAPAQPLYPFEAGGKIIEGLSIDHYVRDYSYAEPFVESIFWFSDMEGKKLLAFERLALDIIVGNPGPFPRYIDELSKIPASRVRSMIWTGEELAPSVDGITAAYAANQADYDTLRLTIDPDSLPDKLRLDDVMVETFIQIPEGAVAYGSARRSRDTIHGEMPEYYEQFRRPLNDPSLRETIEGHTDLEILDGKKYIYIGSMTASESKPFKHDSELYLYTEGERSGKFAGSVCVLYWYDSLDPNAEPFKKEYIVRKMDPFTLEARQKAYTDESQIPEELEVPVIIISKGEEITDLYLVIKKMPTSDPNHIYYDLYVADADGIEQKLGGDAIVIIPYPDERLGDAPYSFKLAHYHNGKKLEYTEENGLLWRTEHGLAFKTKDFSPFVLSWEEIMEGIEDADALVTDPTGVDTLPKTGDHSPSMLLMLGALLVSILGTLSLRRSRT